MLRRRVTDLICIRNSPSLGVLCGENAGRKKEKPNPYKGHLGASVARQARGEEGRKGRCQGSGDERRGGLLRMGDGAREAVRNDP